MNNDFCFRPIWLWWHPPTDQQWYLWGDTNGWVFHWICYFSKILNGWEWSIDCIWKRAVWKGTFPAAQEEATDPFPGIASLCAGHDFPLLAVGSHWCAFHRDTELSWGTPAAPWKKQAAIANPPETGKTAGSERAALRRSASLTGHSLNLRNPLGWKPKIYPYNLSG